MPKHLDHHGRVMMALNDRRQPRPLLLLPAIITNSHDSV